MNPKAFHRQRPLVCIALFFGVGVCIGACWGDLPIWLPLVGVSLAAALLAVSIAYQKPTFIYAVCFLVLFTGIYRAHWAANPTIPSEGKVQVSARVSGLSERREVDGRIKAVLKQVKVQDLAGETHHLSAAYWTYYPERDAPLPVDGQQVIMESQLYHPMGQQNPYGFDFRTYLLQRGIPVGLSGARLMQLTPATQGEPQDFWLCTRLSLAALLDEAMGNDSALMKALILGSRDDLPEETVADFRDAGIAHVLAVSGLHVGILAAALLYVLRRLRMPPRARFAVVAVVLLCYCRLLDFSAPVVRAALMSCLLMAGQVSHERVDPLTSLSVAFMTILAVRPLDILNAGFQLSFLAVLGIFTMGDRLQSWYAKVKRRKPSKWDGMVLAVVTTISASLFTAPVVMRVFHRFPLVGFLFSPIACLVVAWLMWGGLLLLPVAAIWMPVAQVLARPLVWVSELFTKVTSFFAGLPFGNLRSAAPSFLLILALYLVLLLSTRYLRVKGWRRLAAGVAALLVAVGISFAGKNDAVRYIQFSVGSADAAVIEDGATTYVIDTAEHGGDLANYLQSAGRDVDILFISHLHNDHIGGLQQLIEADVDIGRIVLPVHGQDVQFSDNSAQILSQAEERGVPIVYAGAGDVFTSDRVRAEVLWPVRGALYPGMDANHSSMALLLDLDGVRLLTAGDLTAEYELHSATPAQVLKVAHHGSNTGTTLGYIRSVSPQLALLSLSDTHQQRASVVMGRLSDEGIPILSTGGGRAVMLTMHPNGIQTRYHSDWRTR